MDEWIGGRRLRTMRSSDDLKLLPEMRLVYSEMVLWFHHLPSPWRIQGLDLSPLVFQDLVCFLHLLSGLVDKPSPTPWCRVRLGLATTTPCRMLHQKKPFNWRWIRYSLLHTSLFFRHFKLKMWTFWALVFLYVYKIFKIVTQTSTSFTHFQTYNAPYAPPTNSAATQCPQVATIIVPVSIQ